MNVKGGHRKHYADNSKLLQLKSAFMGVRQREGEQSAPVQRDTRSLFLQDRYAVLGLALSDKLRPDEEQKPWTTANSIPSPVLLNTP